jgi:serine/threonine-protein kinase
LCVDSEGAVASTTSAQLFCPVCRATYDDPRFGFCMKDGARLRPVAGLGSTWVGRLIRELYRVLRFLGAGAMAEVYEADHLPSGRRVAVKLMRSHLAADPTMVERFKREARLGALIAHPNVVAFEDFGVLDEGTVYLVMELLVGRSLEDALKEGPLDPAFGVQVAREVCAGLGAAHDQRIVHRDVKPSNIFLVRQADGTTTVKLLDLGIAKLAGAAVESNLTATGVVFGTPLYMSPEQAQGLAVDFRSDIYSLGIVLYRMLTGQDPFSATSFVGLLTKQVTELPVWPAGPARARRLPEAAERLVMRALAKNPDHRHQSAGELGSALADLAATISREGAPACAGGPAPSVATPAAPPATVRQVSLAAVGAAPDRSAVAIAPNVYWVGRREGAVLERNSYLRVYHGEGLQLSVLLDPGPPQDLELLAAKVGLVIGSLKNVDFVFLNHPDPDVCPNATTIQELNPRAHIWCSEDTWRLVHFYGLRPQSYSAVEHFRDYRTKLVTGHHISFVPTPFCHFRGAVMYYDHDARVLFSGDLFGGLSRTHDLLADDAAWAGIEIFHQLYMPSRTAIRRAVEAVRRLDPPPLIIAPQHGGLWCGEAIAPRLDRMLELEVGVDGLAVEHGQDRHLECLNDIVSGLVELVGGPRVAAELRWFAADGSFPNVFVFAGEHRIVDIKIQPRAATRAFLDRIRAIVTPEQQPAVAALITRAVERHGLRSALETWALLTEEAARRPSPPPG